MTTSLEGIPDHSLLREAGELLYGPRWQRQMADATGIPHSTISYVVMKTRPLSVDQRQRLLDALVAWSADVQRRRARVLVLTAYLTLAVGRDIAKE